MLPDAINPDVRIGHVHLSVADLERSLRFYCGVLGFELMQRMGDQAAFVSAGGYHHHIGQYLGKPRWFATATWNDGAVSRRHSLSGARRVGRCTRPTNEGSHPIGWRERSWRK